MPGIGDVNSTEKGSGARFNEGKPPMNYIPFRQQIPVFERYVGEHQGWIIVFLRDLDRFERGEISMGTLIVNQISMGDLRAASFVWEYGAKKYAAWNWTKGMPWSVPLGCISRHLQAIVIDEEEIDAESKCTHWGHVVCNLLMLEHYENFYREGDDRPDPAMFKQIEFDSESSQEAA